MSPLSNFAPPRRLALLGWAAAALLAGQLPAVGRSAPLDYVALPGFGPQELSTVVELGPAAAGSALELRLPDVPAYSAVASYTLSSTGTDRWSIVAVDKKQQNKAVAQLAIAGGKLHFQWLPSVTRVDGGPLRCCLLELKQPDGSQRTVVLRAVQQLPPLVVDFKKELSRLSLGDDLPGDAGLKLIVDRTQAAPPATTISDKHVPLKQSVFVVMKPATDDVPGARLRLVLWKSGQKPDVVMRPELTPISTPENIRALEAASKPKGAARTASRPSVADNAVDPTSSANQPSLAFTIKSLAGAKGAIQQRIQAGKNQILIDNNLIDQKQTKIANFNGFIGTSQEVTLVQATIARLRSEISVLRSEISMLDRAIPELQKQLEAFPPLETLGNDLHEKMSVHFRVVYNAGPHEVTLMQAGTPTE